MRPKILILREPTDATQPLILKILGRAIAYPRDALGLAIALVEQYLGFCHLLAAHDRIMDRGEIVHHGPSEDFDTPDVHRHLSD